MVRKWVKCVLYHIYNLRTCNPKVMSGLTKRIEGASVKFPKLPELYNIPGTYIATQDMPWIVSGLLNNNHSRDIPCT